MESNGVENRKRWRFGIAAVSALLALFLLDAAVFRTRFYPSLVAPESTTGWLEMRDYQETHRKPTGARQLVLLGDSRMNSGFAARLANEVGAGRGYEFASLAVLGSSPRCWYYQLRDV